MAGDGEDEEDEHADGNAGETVEAQPVETGIAKLGPAAEIVVGQAVGHQKRDAARHIEHAERRHEGRHPQIGDQHAVDRADHGPEQAGEHHHHPDGRVEDEADLRQSNALHQEARDDAGQPQGRADREIDAAIKNDEQHADGEQPEDRHMRGHDQEIADGEIVRRHQREDDDDGDQREEGAAFEQQFDEALFALAAARRRLGVDCRCD